MLTTIRSHIVRTRVVVAVILLVVGLVWAGQGIGLIGGSFMSGQAVWAVIGAILIVFACALLQSVHRESRRATEEDE